MTRQIQQRDDEAEELVRRRFEDEESEKEKEEEEALEAIEEKLDSDLESWENATEAEEEAKLRVKVQDDLALWDKATGETAENTTGEALEAIEEKLGHDLDLWENENVNATEQDEANLKDMIQDDLALWDEATGKTTAKNTPGEAETAEELDAAMGEKITTTKGDAQPNEGTDGESSNSSSNNNTNGEPPALKDLVEQEMGAWYNAKAWPTIPPTEYIDTTNTTTTATTDVTDEVPTEETFEDLENELEQEEIKAEDEEQKIEEELNNEGYTDGTDPMDDEGEEGMEWNNTAIDADATAQELDESVAATGKNITTTGEAGIVESIETTSTPGEDQEHSGWTGEGDDLNQVPVPTEHQVAAPTPTTTNEWNGPTPTFTFPPAMETKACSDLATISDQIQCRFEEYPFVFYAVLAFVPLLLICCCRRYCCRPSKESRGEYRAVAAQYGDMSFDNTFSDNYSDDGMSDDDNGMEDVEESWGKSGKRVLEMGTIKKGESNGGLSLEEMNG